MTRILIVKPSSLGDIVHALPTFHALRAAHPAADIHWLVKAEWAPILDGVDGLTKVWRIHPGASGWLSLVPGLRAARFDCVLDLQGLFRSGAMSWLTGARRRVGFAHAREGTPMFYTEKVAVPTPDMHAVDRYLLVADVFGARPTLGPVFGLKGRPEDRPVIERLLRDRGIQGEDRWIAVNPAARWVTKRWPVESFAAAADRIEHERLGRVVLIGGPDDRALARQVISRMQQRPVVLTGSVPVGLLPALLASAGALLTNDSGPMHIAAAVGTPVVALFGPTSPLRTGPYGAGHVVLQQKLPCSPCFSRRCHNGVTLQCLLEIVPEEAVAAVRTLLESRCSKLGVR